MIGQSDPSPATFCNVQHPRIYFSLIHKGEDSAPKISSVLSTYEIERRSFLGVRNSAMNPILAFLILSFFCKHSTKLASDSGKAHSDDRRSQLSSPSRWPAMHNSTRGLQIQPLPFPPSQMEVPQTFYSNFQYLFKRAGVLLELEIG